MRKYGQNQMAVLQWHCCATKPHVAGGKFSLLIWAFKLSITGQNFIVLNKVGAVSQGVLHYHRLQSLCKASTTQEWAKGKGGSDTFSQKGLMAALQHLPFPLPFTIISPPWKTRSVWHGLSCAQHEPVMPHFCRNGWKKRVVSHSLKPVKLHLKTWVSFRGNLATIMSFRPEGIQRSVWATIRSDVPLFYPHTLLCLW